MHRTPKSLSPRGTTRLKVHVRCALHAQRFSVADSPGKSSDLLLNWGCWCHHAPTKRPPRENMLGCVCVWVGYYLDWRWRRENSQGWKAKTLDRRRTVYSKVCLFMQYNWLDGVCVCVPLDDGEAYSILLLLRRSKWVVCIIFAGALFFAEASERKLFN